MINEAASEIQPECPHGTEEKFKCPFPGCNKYFISKSVLERHIRVHTGEKPYICPVCGKGFSQHGNMTKHLKTHENSHLRWDRNTNSKPFKCHFPGCNKSFTAKTTLQSHLLSCHGKRKLESDELLDCDQKSEDCSGSCGNDHFSSKSNLGSNKVSNSSPDSSSRKPISICLHEGCNLTFYDEKELREHIYAFTPGLNAEHNFLVDTVVNFADLLVSWSEKSQEEKESIITYAKAVKETVSNMKIVPPISNSKNSSELSENQQLENSERTSEPNTAYEKESFNQDIEHSNAIRGIEEMSSYFENQSKPSAQNTTGMYSSLIQNHNFINEGWNSHSIDQHPSFPAPNTYAQTVNPYQSNIVNFSPQQYPELINYAPNRTLFSWEEAIMRSRSMMSEGISHPLFIIHPCHASLPGPYGPFLDSSNAPNLINTNENSNHVYQNQNNFYKNNQVSESKKAKIEYSNL